MIELTVNGTPFTDFVTASATLALDALANDFSFTASAVDAFPPVKQGDAITVLVDGEKVLTGSVDEVSGNDSEGAHTVTYTGRDKTSDLVDSQVDRIDDIKASATMTLKRVIEIVIEHLGVALEVVDKLDAEPFNEAEDVIVAEVGDGAFEERHTGVWSALVENMAATEEVG